MSSWNLLIVVGAVACIAAAVRLLRSTGAQSAFAIMGLASLALCLTLNVKPIYLAIDPAIGGNNSLYLVVQLTFVIAMFFLTSSFAPTRHPITPGSLTSWSGVALATVTLALVCILFSLAEMPTTAYRVEPYREEWQVLAFTQLVNVYSAGCAILVIRRANARVRVSPQPIMQRLGCSLVGVGFAIGLLTAIERLTLVGLTMTTRATALEGLDGALVVATCLSLVVGFALLFESNRQLARRGSPIPNASSMAL
ncbi:hypothetical protein IT072_20750 (plasmid) [Leifsonia sp. ZF2019]|uniref:hypothetical protein n=1 Tax=Leifsonia sp. ZF2019 TaxID=2781978 RepID=UPI001CC00932|nr:hypothetical protein [Leifsonia sp. ZF2019]UAJ81776.1 hypothetical protein IT072_20750 [Leifsonia sp. ZF2019]